MITEGKLRLGVLRYMVYLILIQDSVFGFHKMDEEEKEQHTLRLVLRVRG